MTAPFICRGAGEETEKRGRKKKEEERKKGQDGEAERSESRQRKIEKEMGQALSKHGAHRCPSALHVCSKS